MSTHKWWKPQATCFHVHNLKNNNNDENAKMKYIRSIQEDHPELVGWGKAESPLCFISAIWAKHVQTKSIEWDAPAGWAVQ